MSDSFVTPWTVACQSLLSMGFSRQEYWSELPCPPPEDLPNPGIGPRSLMSPALAGGSFTTRATWEAHEILKGDLITSRIYEHSTFRYMVLSESDNSL